MTTENRSQEPSTPSQGALPSVGRRRLFQGVAGSAGVLLSVQAKTALGNSVCRSPSAMMSGNTSPRPNSGVTCSGGLSPGFWKVPQKFNHWGPAGATHPTFSVAVSECTSGMQNLSLDDVANPGTMLADIGFLGAPVNASLWGVMAFPGSFTGGQLMRHLGAAWLNANYFASPAAQYPLTRQQVLDMWNATKSGGLYCPGTLSNCGASGWTAEQVINYISGMYDINSRTEPGLCKP